MRDRGQYYRDTFALEAIEVLMGPSSMLFGRGSTGGVINQVTKKPGLKQATELSVPGARPTASCAPPPTSTRRSARTTRRVNGDVPVGQGLDRSTTPTSWTSAWHRRSSSASARRPRSRWGRILQHRKDNVNYGVPPLNGFPINVPRNVNYGLVDDYTEQDVIQLNATVDHKFSGDLRLPQPDRIPAG